MDGRPTIFLCYSSADRDVARQIALALGRHRVEVWWDQARLEVGSELDEVLREAIGTSQWFGLLMSRNALESEWVARELAEATSRESKTGSRIILPILIEECNPPRSLVNRAHADFRSSFTEGLEKLLEAIGSPYRRELLDDLCSEVPNRIRSAWSIVETEDQAWWISQIVEILGDRSDPRRPSAITALRSIGPERLRGLLPELLRDSSTSVIQRAITSVGELNDRSLRTALLGLANHGDPGVRQVARQTLGQFGP